MEKDIIKEQILVTGGTSGLGLEIVKLLLRKGYPVIATGRQIPEIPEYGNTFKFIKVDFSNLEDVAAAAKKISSSYNPGYIVNNAGILSPPVFQSTINKLEYTFQVNYLSHLLINEIIAKRIDLNGSLRMVFVTSPVYRLADKNLVIPSDCTGYRPFKAYSSSKLFLTFAGEFLSFKHSDIDLQYFSFDPGTFRSGIYRTQYNWFKRLYQLGSPLMKSPAGVAEILTETLFSEDIKKGMIYDCRRRFKPNRFIDEIKKESFRSACYHIIEPYLTDTEI